MPIHASSAGGGAGYHNASSYRLRPRESVRTKGNVSGKDLPPNRTKECITRTRGTFAEVKKVREGKRRLHTQ